MAKYYAWTDIHNGGKTEEARDGRTIVIERYGASAGDVVTKKGLSVSDDEWDAWLASGVIRPYPIPETLPGESPAQAVVRSLVTSTGDLDPNLLIDMALSGSGQNEEEVTEDVPEGA